MFKTNYTTIPTNGLVLDLPLDGNANAGVGSDGTATNITWVPADKGYVSECASCNGSSSYISVATNLIPSGVQSYFAFWVNPADLSGGDTFSSTNPRNIIDVQNTNVGFIRFLGARLNVGINNGSWNEAGTDAVFTINEWQFVEVLITPNDKIKIWRNGILLENNYLNATIPATWNTGANTYIGRQYSVSQRYYNGKLGLIKRYTSITDTNNNLHQEGLRRLGPLNAKLSNGFKAYSTSRLENGKILEISKPANGGVYYDQTGNGNNSTSAVSVTDSSDGIYNVMSFNGSNSNISIIHTTPNIAMTLSAIIKTSSSSQQAIFDKWFLDGSNLRNFIFRFNNSGQLFFIISSDGGSGNIQYITTNNTFNDGKYHLVNAIFSAGKDIEIWVDGIKQSGTIFGTAKSNLYSGGGITAIGKSRGANIEYFNGDIINPVIYNRALSDEEILEDYYSTFIPN